VGPRLEPTSDGIVVVSDGRIAAVGPAATTTMPTDAEVVDAAGLTLMPGFIDAHVHIGFYPPAEVLHGGVTTVRDLAWPPERIFPLVERSAAFDFDGPTIVAAGQMLTVPGGYPMRAGWAPKGTGRAVTSIADARAAVTEQIDSGATTIKVALNAAVGPTLDLATLKEIVAVAHEFGTRVTGHVYGLDELDKALNASMDELAHMLMSPEQILDVTIARMVSTGMVVVPTLSCFFGRDQEIAIDNLARFRDAGGTVMYGTDLGNEGPVPGIDPREVDALSRAGVGPLDIVTSATTVAARLLRLDDVGQLEPGFHADIVGVRGDATTQAAALTNVEMVLRRGRRVR
jgi:imidazolonepropionase-like amidohydrolase